LGQPQNFQTAMKVLALFDSTFPYSQGGRETGLFHLAKHGAELGLGRIDFITMAAGASARSRFPDLQKHSSLSAISGFQQIAQFKGYNFFARLFDRLSFAQRAAKLGRHLCKENSYDWILAVNAGPTGLAALELARAVGARSVINLRSHYSRELELTEPIFRPLLKRYREIETRVIREADLLLTNGDDTYDLCVRDFQRKRPTQAVHNGVDVERFTAQPRPRRDSVLLVSNNPLRDIKGPQDAIEAISQLPADLRARVKLQLFGGGPNEKYKALASEKGVAAQVEFLGDVSHFEMPRHLQEADIALHPILFSVGTTHASLETLAAGLPLVAYDSASLRSICRDGKNGCLIKAGDTESFSKALAALVRDAGLREKMGAASRDMAQEFSWPKFAERVFTALARHTDETTTH
jgi:glycosyltransferase involved in cell wall biosynthesis